MGKSDAMTLDQDWKYLTSQVERWAKLARDADEQTPAGDGGQRITVKTKAQRKRERPTKPTLTNRRNDMDYMLEEPEEPIRRRRDEELEPDEYSDEEADRAEDRWIAERDNLYR